MKKTLTMMLLACCMQASAQNEDEFKIGPRLGINWSTLTEVDDAEMKAGLVAGGYMVYSFQEHFGVSADVLYSMDGAKYKNTFVTNGISATSEEKLTLSYIRIPVMLNFFAGQLGNAIRPKLMLGPSLGFLMKVKNESEVTVQNNGTTNTVTTTSTSKNGYNTIDFGAVIGGGVNIRLADRLWLDTDLRYYMGASDLYDNDNGNDGDMPKNQHLQLSFGLGIGLGR